MKDNQSIIQTQIWKTGVPPALVLGTIFSSLFEAWLLTLIFALFGSIWAVTNFIGKPLAKLRTESRDLELPILGSLIFMECALLVDTSLGTCPIPDAQKNIVYFMLFLTFGLFCKCLFNNSGRNLSTKLNNNSS